MKLNLAENLQLLRKKNRLSQEELADKLSISRQAVSKWESGQSTPDLNKLIILAELYNVTIDSLLKDINGFSIDKSSIFKKEKLEYEKVNNKNKQVILNINSASVEYEYKSERTLFGIPLVHINIGRNFKKTKGIVAVGNVSYGVVALGLVSFGVFSFGVLSVGLVSLGVLALGLLAGGAISIGIVSFGAISIGIFSVGALSIGKYATGAAAIASDIALGDYANANIAIGNTVDGINTLPLDTSVEEVKSLIKQEYPNLGDKFIKIVNSFVRGIPIR